MIIDLTLPDGSGLDVLEVLRASGSTAHVIVLSESTSELDHLEALHRGADDFVVKPFFLKLLVLVGRHIFELVAPKSQAASAGRLADADAGRLGRLQELGCDQGQGYLFARPAARMSCH